MPLRIPAPPEAKLTPVSIVLLRSGSDNEKYAGGLGKPSFSAAGKIEFLLFNMHISLI